MTKKNVLKEKSFAFAVRSVKLCRYLRAEKQEFILSKQILRSGTSIGANIVEACGAQSDNDFIAKLHISLKEANESQYWIRLLQECEYISHNQGEDLIMDVGEIIALITASLKTIKKKHVDNKKNEE